MFCGFLILRSCALRDESTLEAVSGLVPDKLLLELANSRVRVNDHDFNVSDGGEIFEHFRGNRLAEAGVVRADVAPEALVMAFDSLFSTQLILENLFEGSFSPSGAYTHETAVDALVKNFVRGTQA